MSSRSNVTALPLPWTTGCTCRSKEQCTCGAQEASRVAVREEVTAHFLSMRLVIYGHLRQLGCSRVDAEDVTQETFLWFYRARLEGRYVNPDSVRPLILTVARRRAIDRKRRQRFEHPVFVELSPSVEETVPCGDDSSEREIEVEQRRELVLQAIQELSPLQRDCLHLRAEGLRLRETSAIVGVSEKRVSEAIQRGITRLRRVIDGLTR